MSYQISYYHDRAMTQPTRESDEIGEFAIMKYPAPTGRETAFARNSGNPDLSLYGYDGDWHGKPPREVQEMQQREKEEWEEKARRTVSELAAPSVGVRVTPMAQTNAERQKGNQTH